MLTARASLNATIVAADPLCGLGVRRTAYRGLSILATSWGLIGLSLERLFATVKV